MSNGKYASFPQSIAAWWGRTGIGHTFTCSTRIKGLLHSWLFPKGSVHQRLVVMMLLDVLAVTQRHVSTIQSSPFTSPPPHSEAPPPPLIFKTSPLEPPSLPRPLSPSRDLLGAKTLPRTPRGPPRGGRRSLKSKGGGMGKGEGGFAIFLQRTTAKQPC